MFLASSTVMTSPKARSELGTKVRLAREDAGLTIDEAAAQAGMSPTTWGKVERGESSVRRLTTAAIERVLGWSQGSVEAILSGGDATLRVDGPIEETFNAEMVNAWADQVMKRIWATDLPIAEKEDRTVRLRVKVAELLAEAEGLQRRIA